MALTLVIANKNYSSWSLRAWLTLAHGGLEFDEVRIALDQPETKANILAYSPNGKVPCLVDTGVTVKGGALVVWDSLAISEYVNEKYLGGRFWPRDEGLRAQARAVTAEMHSGFAPLRTHMSMHIRERYPDKGRIAQARDDVAADIERIKAIWLEALDITGGPFLFGDYSIADSFFAPVAARFVTYGVDLRAPLAAWSDLIFALPAMRRWVDAAKAEKEVLSDH